MNDHDDLVLDNILHSMDILNDHSLIGGKIMDAEDISDDC